MGFLKKVRKRTRQQPERKPREPLDTDFMRSLIFEDNPFENEEPEIVRVFDVDGNEVEIHEQKRPTRNHSR